MRLVTYDRAGVRRLGAWAGDALVDLPDAVGHPAFPATLEGLVGRGRGTAMEAARAALSNPEHVEGAVVRSPRLLAPIVLDDGAVLGPDGVVTWPYGLPCQWQPEVACVLGRGGRNVPPAEASRLIFGYLLVSTWTAPSGDGAEAARTTGALGPCLVTAEDVEPAEITLTMRVNRGVWARERIGDAGGRFAASIARASKDREVLPGEVFSCPPFDVPVPGGGRRILTRDATVEIEAGPLGVLRNRVRFRSERGTAAGRNAATA